MRTFFSILTLLSAIPIAQAEEKPQAQEKIVKLSENKYQIGLVTLDKSAGEISFEAETGTPESIIEFVLCTEKGKLHENLFTTKADPLHLNIALKLLGYKESKELFKIIKDGTETEKYHQVSDDIKKASRLNIFVTLGKETKHLNQWIYNKKTEKTAKELPYIYCGSYLTEGKFEASQTGDIIAILTSRGCLANFSNEGRLDDSIWFPNPKLFPKEPTKVTLTIKKHKEKK